MLRVFSERGDNPSLEYRARSRPWNFARHAPRIARSIARTVACGTDRGSAACAAAIMPSRNSSRPNCATLSPYGAWAQFTWAFATLQASTKHPRSAVRVFINVPRWDGWSIRPPCSSGKFGMDHGEDRPAFTHPVPCVPCGTARGLRNQSPCWAWAGRMMRPGISPERPARVPATARSGATDRVRRG